MLHDESTASLTAGVVPFAQDSGRLFFYLIGAKSIDGVALTLSEASLNPNLFSIGACGDEGSEMDAEDPRCAKLTISGDLRPCAADSCSVGEAALFKTHPAMKDWPASHHFTVHELSVKNIWMIANYGGGVVLTPVEYFDATPASFHLEEELKLAEPHDAQIHDVRITEEIPDWSDKVARSRWVVHNSLWTTVSTISTRLEGTAFGNIRSVTDGVDESDSTGLPIFYLPTPDPTNIDIEKLNEIVLTFSEASVSQRVNNQGQVCDEKDPGDPLCAQVVIQGKAVPLKDIKRAMSAFKATHPLAPWLAEGGAHTGGQYFTIEISTISILDYYGGPTSVSVDDYLSYSGGSSPSSNEAPVKNAEKKKPLVLDEMSSAAMLLFMLLASFLGGLFVGLRQNKPRQLIPYEQVGGGEKANVVHGTVV
eukprot:CAMPEP_0118704338 /NCGR_PEP_ID=MMETSP0800-20121206/19175_1 /TAXON_ID=210618 ORGANISM="Striatella unipunctata, Strain CCMP2910" /NCGR_SAMPLE_ID=MMETSP0800 /ASSEMBLY_ACC=CAM_ASM_000638 /LENGTH=421 /DNA_ID=CAMNT_0006606207 /DNA_START=287 /DNA_END=1552 /DNA_ORIENTATION=+